MEPKTVRVGQYNINYYESAGTGPTAVLVHGNSLSALSFQRQIESPLGERFRIVAIDLPGHGLSDDAKDPESFYIVPGYANALCTFVGELGVEEAVFVGWSLGGHVVMEASRNLKSAKGLMLFGAPPVGFPPPLKRAYLPHPAFPHFFAPELTDSEVSTMATSIFSDDDTEVPAFFSDDIRRTDPMARSSVGASLAEGKYRDEVDIVAELKIPLAIIHGGQDRLVNGSYFESLKMPTLWRGKVQLIPEAGHTPQWEQSESFNTLLEDFLEDCNG